MTNGLEKGSQKAGDQTSENPEFVGREGVKSRKPIGGRALGVKPVRGQTRVESAIPKP